MDWGKNIMMWQEFNDLRLDCIKAASTAKNEIISITERLEVLAENEPDEQTIKARHKRRSLREDVADYEHDARVFEYKIKHIEMVIAHGSI